MKYTTILFDADGTLLDFLRCEREAIAETFLSLGINVDNTMLDDYSHINDSLWKALERGEIEKERLKYHRFEILYEKYGIDVDPKQTAAVYMNALSQRAYLIDGAEELCRSLYGKAKMYIVTNGVKSTQDRRLAISGLLKYFDGVFISECTGYEKPHREFFDYVAEHIPDFSKSETIIIGDSLSSDILGGINYGIDTCWYSPSGKEAPADIKGRITYTSRSLSGIYNVLTEGDRDDM